MIRRLLLKIGLAWIGREIRAAAEGKRGPRWQALYLHLLGVKTWIGLVLACATACLVVAGEPGWAEVVTGTVAAFLIGVGLLDKSWRATPPDLERFALVRLLREHAGDLTAAAGLAYAALATCSPATCSALARVHLTCGSAALLLTCVGAVLVQLGVDVHFEPPPKIRSGKPPLGAAGAAALAMALAVGQASAQEPTPAASPSPIAASMAADETGATVIDASTWTLAVVTRGEKREYIGGRASLDAPTPIANLKVFGRVDITGTQDSGTLDWTAYQTFRSVETGGGTRYVIHPSGLAIAAVAGVTWSIEGSDGPLDPRMWSLLALLRVPLPGGGYGYVGGGHRGPVGGPAVTASITYPLGATRVLVDYDLPFRRAADGSPLPWVLRSGIAVPIKRWVLR